MASTRAFDIPTSKTTTTPIHIHEPADAEKRQHLGLSTWGASQILASQIHLIPVKLAPTDTVLEIGAGTGLVGLSAAINWNTSLVVTDLPEVVSNLDANIALNLASLEKADGSARAATLDWASPSGLILHDAGHTASDSNPAKGRPLGKFKVILAADTVYAEEHSPQQCDVVFRWLERSEDARFCIAYPLRVAYLDHIRELWQILENGGLECLEEGKGEIGQEWDDECLIEWSVWKWAKASL